MKNFFILLAVAAVSWSLAPSRASGSELEPRFNEAYRSATHNSYWILRSSVWDPFASGVQERLLDQLLFDRVRALEIDIHKSKSKNQDWRIYHTNNQTNVLCTPLDECLKQLEQFQYALPQHEPVTVMIELKELFEPNWDSTHTPADLDAIIEKRLGPYLYRPRDFLSRCTPGSTMRQCAAQSGWPTVREMRGKFVFTVLGNWRWCTIGDGPMGWATYATWGGGVAERTAFPMESDFGNWVSGNNCGDQHIPEPTLNEARQASVVLQVENFNASPHNEDVAAFLAAGGVVRAGDSPSLAAQQARIAAGYQMFQSDYPWFQQYAGDWISPYHAFHPENFEKPELLEPGFRIALQATHDGAGTAFATASADVGAFSDWETFPSTTRTSPDPAYPNLHHARGQGCLRAESLDASESASICRQTISGKWNVRKPMGEDVGITVQIRHKGKIKFQKIAYSGGNTSIGVGDTIRMTTWSDRAGSCVSLFTASEMQTPEVPAWTPLKTVCFPVPLPRQGLQAAQGDVLFVNTKKNGVPVRSWDLELDQGGSEFQLEDHSILGTSQTN